MPSLAPFPLSPLAWVVLPENIPTRMSQEVSNSLNSKLVCFTYLGDISNPLIIGVFFFSIYIQYQQDIHSYVWFGPSIPRFPPDQEAPSTTSGIYGTLYRTLETSVLEVWTVELRWAQESHVINGVSMGLLKKKWYFKFQTLFKWVSQFHINKVHLIKKNISKGLPIFSFFSGFGCSFRGSSFSP